MMMSPVTVALACILACSFAARLPYRSPVFIDENSLSPVAKYGGPVLESRDWARIKHSGPRLSRVAPGGRLELECEANGSPPPSVQWFHNTKPISQSQDESNSIGGLRLGSVRSRLVIDCVMQRHQGTYTCMAVAGSETVISSPSLVFVSGNNSSGLMPACADAPGSPPRIVTWSPNAMETIGNDVILPCMSVGRPSPSVYWVDSQNQLVTPSVSSSLSDDRYKVLDSGELMISAVRWADMGLFTCVAESALGRDSVTTFLYPMSKDR